MSQTISLKKKSLRNIHILLEGLSLKGAVSRARTKLDQKVLDAFKEVGEEERSLIEEYDGTILENGQVKFPLDEGTKISSKKVAYEKADKELFEESVIIPEHTEGQFERLLNTLNDYDQELSGNNASAYDELLDALEALNMSEGE
ncbi:DUF1617 family protein [Leuconostoc pseudomesenteroides]|uniref:DUF1617 family protein n=1 Tax=Leuconostoc pseudomesenteroides TaxID=33968 RepID=UPI00403D6E53